ncbi:MAG: methyl-accepting chemotaxis protein [Lachnospiraceae bacterium]|jgi:methyl-accepting chemotaxis protein|nr:methyl-accepting chemotaxis protein [Lachnospiraceae bacterium]
MEKKAKRSISTKLLTILLPMVTVAIIFVILFLSMQAKSIITSLAQDDLLSDANANAAQISGEMEALTATFEQYAQTLERVPFKDIEEMKAYLEPSLTFSELTPNGFYTGLEDGTWIDPSGWEPDADYVITERDWYKDGIGSSKFTYGTPYVDSDSGSVVVTMSRKITLADGRVGVAAVDVTLDSIVAATAQFKPMETGMTMMLAGEDILSYYEASYNGSKISDHPEDAFLVKLKEFMNGSMGEIRKIAVDGTTYYVALNNVEGTSWTMVSSVSEKDVLKSLSRFMMICYIVMIVMILVIGIVMYRLIKTIVTKPVRKLTKNIQDITTGDFTVQIDRKGTDEIAVMNGCMADFIESMRMTLGDMQGITGRLSEEAQSSLEVSGELNRQAGEQSTSMLQIKDSINGISDSVTELADNATSLAGSMSDLTNKGYSANETMEMLVKQAENGQKDMEHLQSTMKQVASSMDDMNAVVLEVDEAAQKINTIVAMINAISSQTNLLSLNASIEAARAGEAGRGFAVVATEIGNLANESANATTEITDIIHDITQKIQMLSEKSKLNMDEIGQSSSAVVTAGDTFAQIFKNLEETGLTVQTMIGMMADVNEIAASVAAISEEQSASTIEIADTIESVVASAAQVADESESVDHSARTVSESAEKVGEFVGTFKI